MDIETLMLLLGLGFKRKAQKSWGCCAGYIFLDKDTFEKHRVVFTVGTSASVLVAWYGYSLRHLHETNVERRLDSIEKAMKSSHDLEHSDIKKIVGSGSCSLNACVATAGTKLVVGSSVNITKDYSFVGDDIL